MFWKRPPYHTSEIIMLEMWFKNYLDSDPPSIRIREGRLGTSWIHLWAPRLPDVENTGTTRAPWCVCLWLCFEEQDWIWSHDCIAREGLIATECSSSVITVFVLGGSEGGVILIRWLARVRNGSQVLVSWQRHLKPGALQLPRPNVPLFRILLIFVFLFISVVFLCFHVVFLLSLFVFF